MLGQGRVVHGNHFGMLLQEFNHFQGILHMTFHAKRQRLQSLQQNESIERTDCGTGITQQYGTDTDGIGSRTGNVNETYSMITRVRFRQLGKLPRATQSNLPLSTITPPKDVPCPPMNFVAEWTTISAPCSMDESGKEYRRCYL